MTKNEFLLECLKRNPQFLEDITQFLRDFPAVFQRTGGHVTNLPASLSDLVEALTENVIAVRPQSSGDLDRMQELLTLLGSGLLHGWTRLRWLDGEYYELLKRTRDDLAERVAAFAQRWPQFPVGLILTGNIRLWRPRAAHSLDPWEGMKRLGECIPEISQAYGRDDFDRAFAEMERQGDRERLYADVGLSMFRAAKIWIPIYQDTTAEDLDWAEIARLQSQLYGRKKRSRSTLYMRYLKAYDLVHAGSRPHLREIAKQLVCSLDQAVRAIRKGYEHVTGAAYPGKRTARLQAAPFASHLKGCGKCGSAKGTRGGLCATGDSLLDEEAGTAPLRERRVQSGTPEVLKRVTKRPGADDIGWAEGARLARRPRRK